MLLTITASANADIEKEQGTMSLRNNRSARPTQAHFAVADGRVAAGTIQVVGETFVAIDTTGTEVGRFPTLREAARALPNGGGND